jgi:hypothetical protein
MLDHARGCVVERRQASAEFGFYPGFDPGDEMTQNIIEHPDLVFTQALAVMQEKIRYASKSCYPLLRRAAGDGFLKFIDDGKWLLQNRPPNCASLNGLALAAYSNATPI